MHDPVEPVLPHIDLAPVCGVPCICVSFSGGADSLVLLFSLAELHHKNTGTPDGFALHIVHFEHGIRGPESLADAEFCRGVANSLGLPFHLVPLDVPTHCRHGEGIEEAARRCRQTWWEKSCRGVVGMPFAVALGHHADDRIETAFLRLMRGSNSSGLDGLQSLRTVRGVTYWRPLLRLTRADVEKYAHALPCAYRTDSTNLQSDYARNKLRNIVLPMLYEHFPCAKSGILTSLDVLACDADALDTQAAQLFREKASASGNSIDFAVLAEVHPAIRYRLMRQLFLNISNGKTMPDKTFMERLEEFLRENASNGAQKAAISSSVGTWGIMDGLFRILPDPDTPQEPDILWDFHKTPAIVFGKTVLRYHPESAESFSDKLDDTESQAFFDADILPHALTISTKLPGDTMTIFGTSETKTLKKLFTDAHVSSHAQKSHPILRDPETSEILWIPHVRRSSAGIVTTQTQRIAKFSAEKLIDVTAAVIMRTDGRVLVTSRPAGKDQAFGWEFPGGKIESDETPEHCIEREIREELAMNIFVHRRIFQIEHDYGKKYVRLTFFSAVSDDEPDAMEHQDFKWLAPADFHTVPMLPADAPFADYLKSIDIAAEAAAIYSVR